jgi:hypothetical protein
MENGTSCESGPSIRLRVREPSLSDFSVLLIPGGSQSADLVYADR